MYHGDEGRYKINPGNQGYLTAFTMMIICITKHIVRSTRILLVNTRTYGNLGTRGSLSRGLQTKKRN